MSEVKTTISLSILINQCANTKQNDKYLRDINHATGEIIHDIFKYHKFNYGFSRYLEFKSIEGNIGFIRPSYKEFLNSICLFLNLPQDIKIEDTDKLTDALNLRIAKLKEITNERELKEEFPQLYYDLREGRKYMSFLDTYKLAHGEDEFYKESKHYYYGSALKQNLNRFITTQVELYRRFVNKRQEYKRKIEDINYNDYIMKYFDKDKVAFYAAYSYLQSSKQVNDDEKMEYYRVVENYLKSNYDKSVSLVIKQKEIDIKELIRDYIKTRYDKDINTTDINSYEDLQNILKQAQEEYVGWVIIPGGKDLSKVKASSSSRYRQLELPEIELERLRTIGQGKNAFYEETNYLAKIVGLMKYKGYVAYIYPNGQILVDREYIEKSPKSATGFAIYNLRVEDFELLSKLDKLKLMHHPKVKRIVHSGNWQDKATSIIEQKGTENDLKKAKKLIRKFKG